MGNIETTTKFFSLKSIFSNEDNYLEAATRGVLYKKAVLRKLAICTGKHLCWSLFSVSLQGRRPATLLKRNSNTVTFL